MRLFKSGSDPFAAENARLRDLARITPIAQADPSQPLVKGVWISTEEGAGAELAVGGGEHGLLLDLKSIGRSDWLSLSYGVGIAPLRKGRFIAFIVQTLSIGFVSYRPCLRYILSDGRVRGLVLPRLYRHRGRRGRTAVLHPDRPGQTGAQQGRRGASVLSGDPVPGRAAADRDRVDPLRCSLAPEQTPERALGGSPSSLQPIMTRTACAGISTISLVSGRPVELIVIDDASTDGLEALMRDTHLPDPVTLRYHRNTVNRGPGPSRNTGLEMVQSDWMMFLDADDLLTAEFFDYIALSSLSDGSGFRPVQASSVPRSKDPVQL